MASWVDRGDVVCLHLTRHRIASSLIVVSVPDAKYVQFPLSVTLSKQQLPPPLPHRAL